MNKWQVTGQLLAESLLKIIFMPYAALKLSTVGRSLLTLHQQCEVHILLVNVCNKVLFVLILADSYCLGSEEQGCGSMDTYSTGKGLKIIKERKKTIKAKNLQVRYNMLPLKTLTFPMPLKIRYTKHLKKFLKEL